MLLGTGAGAAALAEAQTCPGFGALSRSGLLFRGRRGASCVLVRRRCPRRVPGCLQGSGRRATQGLPMTTRVRTGRPPARSKGSLASQLGSFSLGSEAQCDYLRNGTLK